MDENERLYERYEDAFFALLMNKVAEAIGSSLMQKNEELLKDPDAAVPDRLSRRCLHTIEKSCQKKRLQRTAKKTLRALNRVALWILIPIFMFVGVFAASEKVRVQTLNYLIETFDFGASYELSMGQNNMIKESVEDNSVRVLNAVPADFCLTTSEESRTLCVYHFINSRSEEFEVAVYQIDETTTGTVTIDTENAEVCEKKLNGQEVSIINKNGFYQIFWLEDAANSMFVVCGENISVEVLQNVAKNIIRSYE